MGPYIRNQPTHRQRHIAKREKYFGVPTLNSPVEDVMFVCRRRRLEPRFVLHRLFEPRAYNDMRRTGKYEENVRKRNKMYAREIYVCAGICILTVFAAN